MGIKGFYGYCSREVKSGFKTIKIVEEIAKYKSENQKNPLIIINLSTLSYYFKLCNKDLLCGYQLNKIKFDLENFLAELQAAGADLEFVFKKVIADDKEWKHRRLNDYNDGCEIIDRIERIKSFEKLERIYRRGDRFPYNPMILVCLIQSAEKFGAVHGCNTLRGKPSVQQVELARQKQAAFIMGLDTFYFLLPGPWKVWCDVRLDMEKMTVEEFDPNVVMSHLELKPEQAPMFACLAGDLRTQLRVSRKIADHFGSRNLFPNVAKFVNKLSSTTSEAIIQETVEKIFGNKTADFIIEDFKKSLKSFEIIENPESKVDMEILDLVKNDFLSIAEEILTNQPIFVNPSFLDMRKTDMATLNDLTLQLIQKTSGILLKNLEDKEPRSVILLMTHGGDFVNVPIETIFPEFEVPQLKFVINGDLSTMEKMQMLFWITDLSLMDFELPVIPEEYLVDCIILLYLMKNKSLKFIEARCILKTLVDARRRAIPLEVSTEYPEIINEKAFRITFLYSKMYFFFQSCLASLGMKNLCPDIQFDGVQFQKNYVDNVVKVEEEQELQTEEKLKEKGEEREHGDQQTHGEQKDGKAQEKDEKARTKLEAGDDEEFTQTTFIDEFAIIVRQ